MKATTETMAAFVAAIGEFPAQVVVNNNTWKAFVEAWTATDVGPYATATVKVKDANVLQRMVSNIEAHNALAWPKAESAVFVTLPDPAAVEVVAAPVAAPAAFVPASAETPAAVSANATVKTVKKK